MFKFRYMAVALQVGQPTRTSLEDLAANVDPDRIPWHDVRSYGIVNRLMPLRAQRPCSGRILAYTTQQVHAFREKMGLQVCVFKIGVTGNPVSRYVQYHSLNFTAMWVIFSSSSVREVHMLEAALISLFCSSTGCRNEHGTGGEGALNHPKATPPFYVYITGGRADQNKRVG